MANKLRKMRLTSVDLVRAGANQKADICIHKSLYGAPEEPTRPMRTISKSDPNRFDYIQEITKFNPYHDSRGRFASKNGGGGPRQAIW